jgi:hypothetical protein
VISNEIISDIANGKILSRRQLYRLVGRSRELLHWLNEKGILIPNKWTKEQLVYELKKLQSSNASLVASDNWNLCRVAKRFYGTWNNALKDVLGVYNQRRYSGVDSTILLNYIKEFIIKFRRLPLREEFHGRTYDRPYWEIYTVRFNCTTWREILALVNLKGVSYFHNETYGMGRLHIYKGRTFLSTQELLIGKYLMKRHITFDQEVSYGNCNCRFDFYLVDYDVYVEYYGLATEDYKKRIDEKRAMYCGRKVIEIFKHDNTVGKLHEEVQRL